MNHDPRIPTALDDLQRASQGGLLTPSAHKNIAAWLTQPRYAEYLDEVIAHIERQEWKELDNAFWTVIPFGTGGRRGRMYPIGSNAINDRTIGESAQGLASYLLNLKPRPERLACAIAYDTRHRSRHFAELCTGIMAANGFHVYFLDEFRATPQLSLAVRHFHCTCGIMVTASHNPPSDNAVKVYWSTGGQVLPPHDANIIDQVMKTDAIQRMDFQQACDEGRVSIVTDEVDAAYQKAVLSLAWPGPRDLKVVFSPLHGVGGYVVPPLLRGAGFDSFEIYQPHATPDGDFPNVPKHVSNPENPAVFDAIVEYARSVGGELVLATDPDCDRMGCSCPHSLSADATWATLNGNQIGALLTDFVLSQHQRAGTLTENSYVIKTLVTTELTRRIAESYGAVCEGNLHVGFKWIAGKMDECGPEGFLFGTEESHGYLAGSHVRDKDGGIACLLMAEMAAELKHQGMTPHQKLDALLIQHGVYLEDQINVQMEGSEGMAAMNRLLEGLRKSPPQQIGGLPVAAVRDYDRSCVLLQDGTQQELASPPGNMLILDLALPGTASPSGNAVAVRPSGTEPKIKFYLFGFEPVSQPSDLARSKKAVADRLAALAADLKRLA